MQSKKTLLKLTTLMVLWLLALSSNVGHAQTTWQPLGPLDTNQPSAGNATYTSEAIYNGSLYIAYVDASTTPAGKVTVMKKGTTGTWTVVGTAGFSAGTATYTSIAISSTGTPYVAFADGSTGGARGGGKASVMSFNGTTWALVGTAGFSVGNATYVNIALDGSDNPYVVYADAGATPAGAAEVFTWNGTTWAAFGTGGVSAGAATYTSIAIDKKNTTVYVAYSDAVATTRNAGTVMSSTGAAWTAVGGATGFTAGTASYTSIALDTFRNPYIAFEDGSTTAPTNRATVMGYNGTTWSIIGTAGISKGAAIYTYLSISATDSIYVAYSDDSTRAINKASVMQYNGTTWSYKGAEGLTAAAASYIGLVVDAAGKPFVVSCGGAGGRGGAAAAPAVVYDYNGARWELIGSAGIALAAVNYTSLVLDHSGTPYAAFSDAAAGNKAVVVKWNGTAWSLVGTVPVSTGAATYVSLAISNKDSLYIAYVDATTTPIANGVTVMKFDGTGWVTVGTAGLSAGSASYTSLAIDKNGTPYVAYADGTVTNFATVMSYTAGAWTLVGTAGFSLGAVTYVSLAIDTNGIPGVAFRDAGNTTIRNSASVYGYVAGAWIALGGAGISAGTASFTSLAINKYTNTPYLSYRDGNAANKATVIAFTNGAWTVIGAAGFTPGAVTYNSLAIDESGLPYVAYADGNSATKVNVMYYDGAAWVNSGNTDFSYAGVTYPSLAIDATGKQYVLVTETGAYAWDRACNTPVTTKQPVASTICVNSNTSFTGAAAGSSNTYQWQVYTGSVWSNISNTGVYTDALSDSLNITAATSSMSGYQYRVIITNACGNDTTAAATLTVITAAAPTIVIATAKDTVCAGTLPQFTSTVILGGTAPAYQWIQNTTNVGTGTTFTPTALANGDQISCVLTSNATCATPSTATSNTIKMTVTPLDSPKVVITASPGDSVCVGTPVTLSSTVTGAGTGTVTYQWQQGGRNVFGGGGTGATYTPRGGGGPGGAYTVIITVTGGGACVATNTATSNAITITTLNAIVPTLSISGNPGDTTCTGTPITYTAAPTGGGTTPAYVWYLNGTAVGGVTTGTYTLSTPATGDSVRAVLTSSFTCAAPKTAGTKDHIIQVNAPVKPKFTLNANPSSTVASGVPVTFVATITNGVSGKYVWEVNGVVVTTATGSIYTTSTLANGDTVSVIVSDNGCGGTDSTAYIIMTVTGINNIQKVVSNVSVFPNPNNGQFTLQGNVTQANINELNVSIVNVLGQEVNTQVIPTGNGHINTNIDLGNLAKGMYFLEIKNDQQLIYTTRVTVQ